MKVHSNRKLAKKIRVTLAGIAVCYSVFPDAATGGSKV